MMEAISVYGPPDWSEARRRAETYLRVLRGRFGATEREQVAHAIHSARQAHRSGASFQLANPLPSQVANLRHPVTLVMESLFDLLSAEMEPAPVATTPPIQRVSMLPEKTEFPLHDGLRRLFRTGFLAFAGVR